MDLKEFAKSKTYEKKDENAEKQAKNIYDKYKDFSKDDLLSEIAKQIKQQKENGTFNKVALLNSLNGLSAFIPQQNMQELREIIERLDEQN